MESVVSAAATQIGGSMAADGKIKDTSNTNDRRADLDITDSPEWQDAGYRIVARNAGPERTGSDWAARLEAESRGGEIRRADPREEPECRHSWGPASGT